MGDTALKIGYSIGKTVMSEEFLSSTPPPDDSGTDTYKRYRYQAYVAFQYCLDCVASGKVQSVIMEHFEDIVIEYSDYWYFAQIKTRNPNQGPWRLSHTLSESGGLRSLYRTFSITQDVSAKYGLFLEGAVARDDPLNSLIPPRDLDDEILFERVKERLQIEDEECKAFLDLVIVRPNITPRQSIAHRNIILLGRVAPHVPHQELDALHTQSIDEILRAMACERLGEDLPRYLGDPNSIDGDFQERFIAKKIDQQRLIPILGNIVGGRYPLLRRLVEPESPQPSDLEGKLLSGGANDHIINDAKRLRSNASLHDIKQAAANLFNFDEQSEDVRERLIVLNNSIVAKHLNSERPAGAWAELLETLMRQAEFVDPNRIYSQDPFLLQGVVCELADECKTDWGVEIA